MLDINKMIGTDLPDNCVLNLYGLDSSVDRDSSVCRHHFIGPLITVAFFK